MWIVRLALRRPFSVAVMGLLMLVADDALVFRGGKTYVAVVRDNHLALAEVTLGYDDGRTVEIVSGIAAADGIAMNVGQSVRDGELVRAVPIAEH